MAMNKADMDRVSEQGCAMGCKHPVGEHPIFFFHPECHIDAPISMIFNPVTLVLSGFCSICYKPFGAFQLAAKPGRLSCAECPDMAEDDIFVWPYYRYGSGIVILQCYWCKKDTAMLQLADSGLQTLVAPIT